MKQVNIHEAKTHLSRLVDEAARGEGFIIAKAGKPMVKVVALEPEQIDTSRRIGFLAGKYVLPVGFKELDQGLDREIEAEFLNSKVFPPDADVG